jgi:hypothetical protein
LVWFRERPYPEGKTNKGFKFSAEGIRNLSESHKGLTPWNKGKKTGVAPWNKGAKGVVAVSLETRRKISAANKGSKSHLWRGGHDRRCPRVKTVEWNFIRKEIYKRDNWKCQVCKVAPGSKLQCHHIVPVRYGGSDDFSNLASVCMGCHKKQEALFATSLYFWGLFVVADTTGHPAKKAHAKQNFQQRL